MKRAAGQAAIDGRRQRRAKQLSTAEDSGGRKQQSTAEKSGGGEAAIDGKWVNLPFLMAELHL